MLSESNWCPLTRWSVHHPLTAFFCFFFLNIMVWHLVEGGIYRDPVVVSTCHPHALCADVDPCLNNCDLIWTNCRLAVRQAAVILKKFASSIAPHITTMLVHGKQVIFTQSWSPASACSPPPSLLASYCYFITVWGSASLVFGITLTSFLKSTQKMHLSKKYILKLIKAKQSVLPCWFLATPTFSLTARCSVS